MDLLRAFRDFRQTGVPSDTFLSILQAEQSLEAPLSFFLQYYSAFFTSGSRLAFLNLCFSICMSLYGISKGVYENLHLNLEDAYNAAEELAAMDTTSEPSTPQAQHLAQVVGLPQPPGMGPLSQPPAVPLPPPPGMGPPPSQMAAVPLPPHPKLPPGMAAAVVQPPPPVGPVQLGGHVKDTECGDGFTTFHHASFIIHS